MYAITLLGLLVTTGISTPLKYAVPSSLKATASNCIYPANFTVSSFTIYTDRVDSSKNTTSFSFADADTGINAFCTQNSTSKATGANSNQYPCDDPNVTFIYQTTGVAGLTLVELACPGTVPQYEASGLVTPDLACTNSTTASTCAAKQSTITGDFDSLEPVPHPPPSSR
ncbi:uncharacterized protein F4822DRAFT_381670 [Hypoxylon trugodes]|uniref:uncharacterized protein n=1 Tax=Hypoxylon trugodes TaxID=326681 RepID=UPI00218E68C8|nr:uncharacterized protein F4822DRAFT_381670 [Hypoxylon trugodes]KAI1385051.1 hypothetical protein F4822DRAFT_381670 [Hypoxylon trugodes]